MCRLHPLTLPNADEYAVSWAVRYSRTLLCVVCFDPSTPLLSVPCSLTRPDPEEVTDEPTPALAQYLCVLLCDTQCRYLTKSLLINSLGLSLSSHTRSSADFRYGRSSSCFMVLVHLRLSATIIRRERGMDHQPLPLHLCPK